MGRDKALIPIGGVPMALRMAGILKTAGCQTVHLVGRQASLTSLGLNVIIDQSTFHHPLLGVAAGLSSLDTKLAVIAPCDLIHIEAHHLQSLIECDGPCVAVSDGQIHPLLAIIPTAWSAKAERLANEGAASMKLTQALPQVMLPPLSLTDANSPSDLPRS